MDITQVIMAIIGLASVLITTFLVPYIKSKTTNEQQQTLAVIVQTAVQAAEQIFVGTGLGQKKKEWVIQYLIDNGVKLNVDKINAEVNALIEAAVYAMNSK